MFSKRLFTVSIVLVLLHIAGYLLLSRNKHSWNVFSSLSDNWDTLDLSTFGNGSSSAINNDVNRQMYVESVKQQVITFMKAQLESNFTGKPYFVTTPCVANSKSKEACVDQNCTQLSDNVTERVQSLFSEKTILTKQQDDLLRSVSLQMPENDIIILSAASSNHYDEMQALLHSLHSMVFPELSKTGNFSLVLWDIGLTSDQRWKTEKCCRCQVISFPFEKFPNRIRDLHTYMWKPMIIRMGQLRARKYVVWQDSSIRYVRFPGPLFERAMHLGVQLIRDFGMKTSTIYLTLPETYAYFGQTVCSFRRYPEIAATFGVYKNDPFVLTAVTNPWARCAFEEKCMSPRPTMPSLRCRYGPCHRFDQSALTAITTTLYGKDINRIVRPPEDLPQYVLFRREDKKANYFKSTGCLK